MAFYEVTLKPSNAPGAKRTYWRAGKQFAVGDPRVVELTKDELEEVQNDSRLTAKKTKAPSDQKPSQEATGSQDSSQPADTEADAPEASGSGEDSGEENQEQDEVQADSAPAEDSSDSEEEAPAEETSEAPSEAELLKLGREELNAKAKEAGVEKPEELQNKQEVAQAIVDAQAPQEADSGATS